MTEYKELITDPANDRYSLFPIEYSDIWNAYKKHKDSFWTAEEIDFSGDLRDWTNLPKPVRTFIELVLAFFSISDGVVSKNLNLNFCNDVTIQEIKYFYAFQGMMENIHGETYAIMIDTLITDVVHRNKLLDSIPNFSSINCKVKWMEQWMDADSGPFAQRLLAFAIVEGVFFSSSFASIYWLRDQYPTMMNGLCFSNELIARDEGMHTEFAVLLYTRYIRHKLPEHVVHSMIKEAVCIECKFVSESLPDRLPGINLQMMNEYVQFTADRLIKELGYSAIYNTKNPFVFMDKINAEGKTNFFERRVSEYGRARHSVVIDSKTDLFEVLDDDF